MRKKYQTVEKIIVIEIFLYIIFMFITKGEAVRNFLLFSGFALWLVTMKNRPVTAILKEPVSIFYFLFLLTILLSSVFSLDPNYSFLSLRKDPLKATMLFLMIATTFNDLRRLKALVIICVCLLVFTFTISYLSFITNENMLMHPDTILRHAHPNRLAVDLNILIVFSYVLLLSLSNVRLKVINLGTIGLAVTALMLSGSRGGIISFFAIFFIWAYYLSRKYNFNFKRAIAVVIVFIAVSGAVSVSYSDALRDKAIGTIEDIRTFNRRTLIWQRLIAAVAQRPVFGWGYGEEIFASDVPFEETVYKEAPVNIRPGFRNPHNAFLRVLFHQGIVGLLSYVLLLFIAIKTFLTYANKTNDLQSYILIACSSLLIGLFVVNSIVENLHLSHLMPILGIGMAAKNIIR